jgi:hypothetical protein
MQLQLINLVQVPITTSRLSVIRNKLKLSHTGNSGEIIAKTGTIFKIAYTAVEILGLIIVKYVNER